ncbi:MAG: molybdopterin-synthase adenylyltransferase MoeB [Propionibacteriaceae bacterium]|jgi:adenylyltransferase/sulfurtransferase|nr:molybdopterin-synthase adenylyltransferase MoeB [Propionibacteriaceae bacterium]
MATPSIIPDSRLTPLEDDEYARYSRHLLLPEVGLEGQQRIRAAKVLIVGTGGLGAPIALYLAAAGVGTLGVLDFDEVEASNLQRQIIHTTKDIDRPKVASARDSIRALNPDVEVVVHNTTLTSANALQILKDYDVIIDGTDNYPTRYLVNDACVLLGKPNIYGSIFQFDGQASVFWAAEGPCYRCLYPEPPPPGLVPSCSEGGVLGVLPGIVGTIQATEALKIILGDAKTLVGRLLTFDAWRMRFRELKIEKDPACPICGEHPTITELIDYEQFCGLKVQEKPVETITATELKARLDGPNPPQLIDVREPHELYIARIGGAINVPLGTLSSRVDEIAENRDVVFFCKVGTKSTYAIRSLQRAGHTGHLINLEDGISGWARDVDPDLPIY